MDNKTIGILAVAGIVAIGAHLSGYRKGFSKGLDRGLDICENTYDSKETKVKIKEFLESRGY